MNDYLWVRPGYNPNEHEWHAITDLSLIHI